MSTKASQLLNHTNRLIIKIGSALLVDTATGEPRHDWIEALADDISKLPKELEISLVSSGAIALGRKSLGIPLDAPSKSISLDKKQAAAAIGQILLCRLYQDIFRARGRTVAQVLLSPADTENRKSHLNARAAMNALLTAGVIPIINENDTTATEEIRFGDNDRLAARVAQMIQADTLLILSTTDGFYTDDPRLNPGAKHIPYLDSLTPDIMALAKEPIDGVSTGGMKSKIEAAKIAIQSGANVMIARGTENNCLQTLMQDGAAATIITASEKPGDARKRWLRAHVKTKGRVVIDDGAAHALAQGRSLLPAGIKELFGTFDEGDAVHIHDIGGNEIAIGLTAYNSRDALKIIGFKSAGIADILGFNSGDEFIHRDDLALLG